MLFIVSCVALVAGYVGAILSWPTIRAHAFGAVAEITALRARAKALEDRIKGVL